MFRSHCNVYYSDRWQQLCMEHTWNIWCKLYDNRRQHEFKYGNTNVVNDREQNGNSKLYGIRLYGSKPGV